MIMAEYPPPSTSMGPNMYQASGGGYATSAPEENSNTSNSNYYQIDNYSQWQSSAAPESYYTEYLPQSQQTFTSTAGPSYGHAAIAQSNFYQADRTTFVYENGDPNFFEYYIADETAHDGMSGHCYHQPSLLPAHHQTNLPAGLASPPPPQPPLSHLPATVAGPQQLFNTGVVSVSKASSSSAVSKSNHNHSRKSSSDNVPPQVKLSRLEARRKRNREAAQRCRSNRIETIKRLEKQRVELLDEIERLRRALEVYEPQVKRLDASSQALDEKHLCLVPFAK